MVDICTNGLHCRLNIGAGRAFFLKDCLCAQHSRDNARGVDVKGVHFTWATGGVMVGGATPERWRVGGAWEVLDHYVPRTPTPFADYF